MASGKTVNLDNLVRLGADRLAAILLGLAGESADVKRRLRLELASEAGSEVIAAEISKRLTAIKAARSFLDWRKRREFVKDLDLQRAMIVERVAGPQPDTALELMWRFLSLAGPVLNRVDDSNGTVGDVFRSACQDLGAIARNAKPDPAVLADRVFAALAGNDWGIYDRLLEAIIPALGPEGIASLKGKLTETLAKQQRGAGMRSWSGGGFLRHALQSIADHENDVDAYAALLPAEDLTRLDTGAELGRRLLAANRTVEALAVLEASRPGRQAARPHSEEGLFLGGYVFGQGEWEEVYLDALEADGRSDQAQTLRWQTFEERLSAPRLRAYLKRLADFDDIEAEDKAMQHALAYKSFAVALDFFYEWPEPARAAKLILARHHEINGDAYHLLAPAASLLDAKHPLAATLLRRAMIEHTLEGARHSRYKHAVRHLLECESLVPTISDYGAFDSHQVFADRLRTTRSRKTGFWTQLAELAVVKRR